MGSLNFRSYEGRVLAEIHAEGDPYGHDGCDVADCHWMPNSHETLYLDIDAAKKIQRELDVAIKQAQKRQAQVDTQTRNKKR